MNFPAMLTKLPYLLMVIYLLSAAGYAAAGDWRRALYWACAFGLTVSVTA